MPATLVEMLISIERQAMDREYTRTLPEAIHPEGRGRLWQEPRDH
jgi:hypothetical protein